MKDIEEEWRDVKGYEGLYQVSNLGRVRTLGKIINGRNRSMRLLKEKILKPHKINGGYLQVILNCNNERKPYLIHRLVAEAFLNNPDNLPCVNHKDECKNNNIVSNLEFCTYHYNNTYGTKLKRQSDKQINGKKSIKVNQYTLDGVFIKTWISLAEVYRKMGFNQSHICQCCKGERCKAYNYIWKYA